MNSSPMTLSELVALSHGMARQKGWWDGIEDPETEVATKIALTHSELSEALEEFRSGREDWKRYDGEKVWQFDSRNNPTTMVHKPEGFAIELADALIRIGDLAGALGIDLDKAVREKMMFNAGRPHRHGGKRV